MTALSVNLNKVALVRNTRHLGIPSVTKAGTLCLQAGAQGITVHPRPDARHIREADVSDLAAVLRDWPDREFNIEGNPLHNLMDFVREVRPQQVTFVPDGEDQFTSDHGWSLDRDGSRLQPLIDECHDLGVRVSLFMDPVAADIPRARELGADRIELYTEPYARAFDAGRTTAELQRLKYRPEVDGLRAIAVLAVIAFHAKLGPFPGGFLGVDIFFVISGFVITRMLRREWAVTGRIDFVAFYERRFKRLTPALALMRLAVYYPC